MSLATIAVNVYTAGAFEYVYFYRSYAAPVDWSQNYYQIADFHFTFSYFCIFLLILTLLWLVKEPICQAVERAVLPEHLPAVFALLGRLSCLAVFAVFTFSALCNVKSRLTYNDITVEWKPVSHITDQESYFLAVNTFHGLNYISLEQNTDELIFGVDGEGELFLWDASCDAYSLDTPYHEAAVGEVSDAEQLPILAVCARRALTNFDVTYVAVLCDEEGNELARAAQAQTDGRIWLDFLFETPIEGVYYVRFELSDGTPVYIRDGMQLGYLLR